MITLLLNQIMQQVTLSLYFTVWVNNQKGDVFSDRTHR